MRRMHSLRQIACALALGASLAANARAQAPAGKPCTPKPSTAEVKRLMTPLGRSVELRDTIGIEMSDHSLIDEAICREKNIVLFLDDRPLKDVVAYPPTDPKGNVLRFPLKRTEVSREVWTHILGRPNLLAPRPTKVSVGLEDQYAIPSKWKVPFAVIPLAWFVFWVVLFIIFAVGFFALARKTDLLRDDGPLPGGGKRRPYSLARTQASWWFFLALAAYMFIGMITGDFSTSITGTVLILMGIGAGTVVSSAFVDASKSNPDATRREVAAKQSLQADVIRLEGEVATADAALRLEFATAATAKNAADAARAAAVAAQTAAAAQTATTVAQGADATRTAAVARAAAIANQIDAATAELAEKKSQWCKLSNENEQFIRDILSDANGVNFHRFQMLAWTVVLGIIFVGHVYKELAMPEFSETLLSLMGISAGTYIGLKIPEPTVPKT